MIGIGIGTHRRRFADFDSDAQALFDRMTTAPTNARKIIINALITGLKDDNNWDELDVLVVLAAADSQASLLDWRNLSDGALVNAPAFVVDRGYTSDGATSYINAQFNPSTMGVQYTQNSASYGVYGRDNIDDAGRLAGLMLAGFQGSFYSPRLANNFNGRINSNSSLVQPNADSRGLTSMQRENSTTERARKNGVNLGTNGDASQALINEEFYILCRNRIGTGADQFSTIQGALYFFGSGSLNHLDFFNRIETYMDAIGAGVI